MKVGAYPLHCHGSNSCDKLGTIMMNRSNHMPRLMNSERKKSQLVLRRNFCDQSDIGMTQLHRIMIHAPHHHCPKTRFHQNSCSIELPPTQPMKNSLRYAMDTTIAVNRHSFAPASRSLIVMYFSSLK